MKKINLAKAILNNKCCCGFIWKFASGKYGYQNDNDLGLDLEAIDCKQTIVRKIYLDKHNYVYQVRCGCDDDGTGATLKTVLALLKECHSYTFTLSKSEKRLCKNYWGY